MAITACCLPQPERERGVGARYLWKSAVMWMSTGEGRRQIVCSAGCYCCVVASCCSFYCCCCCSHLLLLLLPKPPAPVGRYCCAHSRAQQHWGHCDLPLQTLTLPCYLAVLNVTCCLPAAAAAGTTAAAAAWRAPQSLGRLQCIPNPFPEVPLRLPA